MTDSMIYALKFMQFIHSHMLCIVFNAQKDAEERKKQHTESTKQKQAMLFGQSHCNLISLNCVNVAEWRPAGHSD